LLVLGKRFSPKEHLAYILQIQIQLDKLETGEIDMMNRKIRRGYIVFLIFVIIAAAVLIAQEKKGVLEPENSNEARLNRLQPPDQVMDAIGVVPGMTVAEIGAGRGRYVVQLAVRVGENGKVYAEDIDAAALKHLDQRCERWGLRNVETVLGEVKDPKLPEGELDLIFIISSYHHFEDPITLLRNARPSLKPDGMLAIGEWLPSDNNRSECTTLEQMESQMNVAGYKLDRIETFLKKNNMYIYIFRLDENQ
jgi:ubiquinone/menaquinone biosynthesis C-methylase UbiE